MAGLPRAAAVARAEQPLPQEDAAMPRPQPRKQSQSLDCPEVSLPRRLPQLLEDGAASSSPAPQSGEAPVIPHCPPR